MVNRPRTQVFLIVPREFALRLRSQKRTAKHLLKAYGRSRPCSSSDTAAQSRKGRMMNANPLLAVLILLGSGSSALAQDHKAHATTPENVQWGPAPRVFPRALRWRSLQAILASRARSPLA